MEKQFEFIDKKRAIAKELEDIVTNFDPTLNIKLTITKLQGLIKKDPDYLESYLYLGGIFYAQDDIERWEECIEEAYKRATNLISKACPEASIGGTSISLKWEHESNRHIILAMIEKGVYFWSIEEGDAAMNIFSELLKADPSDNCGVRFYMLAILQGLEYSIFSERFEDGDYFDDKVDEWFEVNSVKFKDTFEWWFKYTDDLASKIQGK